MLENISIGSCDVHVGDPTTAMELIDGLQGEISVNIGVDLVGPKPNRARGAMVKGSIYAFLRPPTITLPVIDETKELLAKLFPSAVLDEATNRLDFGALPKLVSEMSLCLVPEVAKFQGVEEDWAIWIPFVAPASPDELFRFSAGGEEDVRPRTVTLQAVYSETDQGDVAIPEDSRLGWMGRIPAALATGWTAVPYTTTPAV